MSYPSPTYCAHPISGLPKEDGEIERQPTFFFCMFMSLCWDQKHQHMVSIEVELPSGSQTLLAGKSTTEWRFIAAQIIHTWWIFQGYPVGFPTGTESLNTI